MRTRGRRGILAGTVALALGVALSTSAQQPAKAPAAPTAPAAAPAAPAAAGAKLSGAELYQQRTCVACHGKDAKTPLLPEYPKIAGQNAEYIKRQMTDIKSGARNNGNTPAMKGIMHLVTDDEIKVLAEWLSTLK